MSLEIVLFYFSGTGNTKLIATQLKQQLERASHQVTLISIENLQELDDIRKWFKPGILLGFGFPVYKFTYPAIFDDFISKIEVVKRKEMNENTMRYFSFCTYCRFPANSLYQFARRMKKINLFPIATEEFKCPSNGIAAMKSSDDYEYNTVMYFEIGITAKIKQFARNIEKSFLYIKRARVPIHPIRNLFDSIQLKIVEKIEAVKYPKLTIDKESCILCGLCSKQCPQQNLIQKSTQVQIEDPYSCLHCLRCMHYCPSKSISFGELTFGPQQYSSKIRQNLFLAADQPIPTEKMWIHKNASKILRRWKMKAILYWITQGHRILRERKNE
ncbi:hypothetical protein NEF87_002364 [Candidatus Lokiarchaeum ossiferum]|uniref:4Fe-4S ferredoxin-type domain-containing protein n=1 Tax=Candidatus Lokiarchaeum ossiferum TaxID=2951803 RepID=A0ABY6HUF0_9ARCH|nr:hypothetical protein NEF87_002364 [Candidatus Lokiarchaeum sp. B-35]